MPTMNGTPLIGMETVKGVVVQVTATKALVATVTPRGHQIPREISLMMPKKVNLELGDWLILQLSQGGSYVFKEKIVEERNQPLRTQVDIKKGVALLAVKLDIREDPVIPRRLYGFSPALGKVFIPCSNELDKRIVYEGFVCWAPEYCRIAMDFSWILVGDVIAVSQADEDNAEALSPSVRFSDRNEEQFINGGHEEVQAHQLEETQHLPRRETTVPSRTGGPVKPNLQNIGTASRVVCTSDPEKTHFADGGHKGEETRPLKKVRPLPRQETAVQSSTGPLNTTPQNAEAASRPIRFSCRNKTRSINEEHGKEESRPLRKTHLLPRQETAAQTRTELNPLPQGTQGGASPPTWDTIFELLSDRSVLRACYDFEPNLLTELIGIILSVPYSRLPEQLQCCDDKRFRKD